MESFFINLYLATAVFGVYEILNGFEKFRMQKVSLTLFLFDIVFGIAIMGFCIIFVLRNINEVNKLEEKENNLKDKK